MNAQEALELLGSIVDFHGLDRAQWQAVATGPERSTIQQQLVWIGRSVEIASADRAAMLRGAHALLPLHGHDLLELASLLLSQDYTPLVWLDVVVLALEESDTGWALRGAAIATVRTALGQAPPGDARARWAVRRMALMGVPIAGGSEQRVTGPTQRKRQPQQGKASRSKRR